MKIAKYSQTNEILKKYEFHFKKKFGQNFLIDQNILNKIIAVSQINKGSIVIEIGPGIGALTQFLADNAKQVFAYEIDKTLKPILDETLVEYPNVQVIYEDFLDADLSIYEEVTIVANLPYYITTPILEKIFSSNIKYNKIVVMMQKEVAQRISAKPNTKAFSSLSVYMQMNNEVNIAFDVPKSVFIPEPGVNSSILELTRLKNPLFEIDNQEKFFKFVQTIFTQKRKTLRNNIKSIPNLEQKALENGFDLQKRAEQLSIEDIYKLYLLL